MERKIDSFIKKLQNEFNLSDNEIGFDYEDDMGYYRVWHTNEALEIKKEERKKISKMLREFFEKSELKSIVVTYCNNIKGE